MRLIQVVIISNLTILLMLLSSCDNRQQKKTERQISVSIIPLKYFAEKIAGDEFTVSSLLPAGSNPATYEPGIQEVLKLSNSKIFFGIPGLGYERAWRSNIEKAVEKYVDVSKGVDLIESRHIHGDHHHVESDPHIWLSCKNASTIAINMHTALLEAWPGYEEVFTKNLNELLLQIEETDSTIVNQLAGLSQRSFMIFHPSLSYFSRDYELNQIPIEWQGKEPSPAHMRTLIDLAKKESISTIFIQKEFPSQKVAALAKSIDAEIMIINPLAYEWDKNMRELGSLLGSGGGRGRSE